MDPVPHVQPGAVELGPAAVDHVGDLAGDELLHVLPGAVVVRAVRDRRLHPEAAHPGPDQVVRAGLGGGVGAAGLVGRGLGEAGRVVELQVAVDLVGGDVVQPGARLADRLQDRERADQVGLHERRRVVQRVVVVGLGGEVHDGVVVGDERLDHGRVGDVAHHQAHPVGGELLERRRAGGVGHLVEHRDAGVGVRDEVVHEVRADEAGAAGDENPIHAPQSRRGAVVPPGAAVCQDHRHARDHPGRRHRLEAPSDHPGDQQAAGPDLRQADDLLPAVHADAGRDPGHPGDHHPARAGAVRAAARRRVAVRDLADLRRAAEARGAGAGVPDRRGAHRRRPGGADPRRQHLLRRRAGHHAAPLHPGRGRRGVRLPGRRPDGVRRGGVRRVGHGALAGGEARAPEEQLRGARDLLLRQRRRGAGQAAQALGPRRAGDHRPEPDLPGRGPAPGRGAAARRRLAGHRHLRRHERRQQLRPHHRDPAGHEDRRPRGGGLAAGVHLRRPARRAGRGAREERVRRLPAGAAEGPGSAEAGAGGVAARPLPRDSWFIGSGTSPGDSWATSPENSWR